MVYVSFRYDDYGNPATPFYVEKRIGELVARYKVFQTYGVVPGWLQGASDFTERVKLLKTIGPFAEIPLHVKYHIRANEAMVLSEFANLREEYSVALLRSAKLYLEQLGFQVSIFVPPWNEFDAVDIKDLALAIVKR